LQLATQIGQEFFPAADAGQITIQVRAPSHLRLDATERRIIDVEAAIAETVPPHELQMVVSEIGLNNDWSAAYSANAGQQDTVIRVRLAPERTHSAQEYAVLLRRRLAGDPKLSDLEFSFDTGGMVTEALNFGSSSPIDVQVLGGSPEATVEFGKLPGVNVRGTVTRYSRYVDPADRTMRVEVDVYNGTPEEYRAMLARCAVEATILPQVPLDPFAAAVATRMGSYLARGDTKGWQEGRALDPERRPDARYTPIVPGTAATMRLNLDRFTDARCCPSGRSTARSGSSTSWSSRTG
jgi:hypothetical protein